MSKLKPRIHDKQTGLDYVLVGDYYIPGIELPEDMKRQSQWEWVRAMNSIASRVEEIIKNEMCSA